MRIALMTHEFAPYPGGIATYCYNLARAAVEIGHEVKVLAPNYGVLNSYEDENFEFHGFNGSEFSACQIPYTILRTRRFLNDHKFDCVHLADLPYILAFRILGPKFDGKTIATCYGSELFGRLHKLSGLIPWWALFTGFDQVVSISQFTKSLLQQHYPNLCEDKLTVTPLGIAPKWFAPCSNRQISNFKQKYLVDQNKTVLLSLARIDKRKGHMTALRALDKLPDNVKQNIVYLVVGKPVDDEHFDHLEQMSQKMNFEVIFTGPIPETELVPAMHSSDIFFLPCQPNEKTKEGFGLVFLEAGACGLPVVSTSVDAIPEVVEHEENGFLLPSDDLGAISNGVLKLVQNPELRQKFGAISRQIAEKYTWQRCAELSYGNLNEFDEI